MNEAPSLNVRVDSVNPHGAMAFCTGRIVDPPYTRVEFYADHRMALPIAEHIRHCQEDGDLPVASVPEWSIV